MGIAGIEIEKPSAARLRELGVDEWPIWTKEVSTFDWSYDEHEVCYLLEGEVEVATRAGTVRFGAGDLVTFPQGLACTWKVRAAVRKHYRFG